MRKDTVRVYNRYLPQWVHRIANGVMASLALALSGAFGTGQLACDTFFGKVCLTLLYASPAGLLVSCVDPTKFSLVEGIAGDDGYDELS